MRARRHRRVRQTLATAALCACAASGLAAQGAGSVAEPAPSAILLIDPERLFSHSDFGARLAESHRAEVEALAAENRKIEAELVTQEKALGAERAGMDPIAFRAAADAFDAKVQRIRQEQDAKERALQTRLSDGRERFLREAQPALVALMQAHGAQMILDRRGVFLGSSEADITDAAIDAVNRAMETRTAAPEQGADAPAE